MFSFLPPPLRFIIAGIILLLNTAILAPLVILISFLRIPVPFRPWQQFCTSVAIKIAELWISINSLWMKLTQKMQWDVAGIEQLKKNQWYFVTANHQSWADIFVVQHLLNRKIPMLKFFLKQELIWVPIIGICWWALDFPFMKRYSKEYLEKHPEKRGKDFESTHRACEKFQYTPVAVFNFLEGTRFTGEKHRQQQSPYKNLLKPKAGGMGFVIGAMGESIHSLLDITISYPNKSLPTFKDFIFGDVNHIMVRIEEKPIPDEFLGKNYSEDEAFRSAFQEWISALWEEKDQQLEALHQLSIERGWSNP